MPYRKIGSLPRLIAGAFSRSGTSNAKASAPKTERKDGTTLQISTVQQLVSHIRSGGSQSTLFHIEYHGVKLPLRVMATHRSNDGPAPLVFFYHGAIKRDSREIPAFEGSFAMEALGGKANIVSIADPALSLSPALRTTWYAGAQGLDVPKAIRSLIADLIADLRPSRVISAGGSTGGHPALYQAAFIPNAVAVLCNPIGHISRYSSGHIKDFRSTCWPEFKPDEPLENFVCDNAATAFTAESSSTVVFLSNARDSHLVRQAAPLQRTLARSIDADRSMLVSGFFAAHSGHSYPSSNWLQWIKAAIESPTTSIEDIGSRYERMTRGAGQPTVDRHAFSADDLAMAKKLYEHQSQVNQ